MFRFAAITVPPVTSALVSLADAKADLGVTSPVDDSYISSLVARASRTVAEYCGRPLGAMTVAEQWQPPLSTVPRPLIASYRVIFGVPALTLGGIAMVGADYLFDAPAGLIHRASGGRNIPWSTSPVAATYTTGYRLPGDAVNGADILPESIQAVCLALVKAGYADRGANPGVIREETTGVGMTIFAPTRSVTAMTLDDEAEEVLNPFRRRA